MSDVKISQLPAASTLDGTELVPIVQSGTTVKTTAQDIANLGGGGGSGTVTTVSVVTANGVSGSVANPTTTPAISLTLGAITPSSVAAVGSVSGSNLSGTNTGDQTIALTGQVTGSGTGTFATTLANNTVTNAQLAQMATHTIKGNATGGTANAADLTGTQVTALLDTFTSSAKGLVPVGSGDASTFLNGAGAFTTPGGGGSGTVTSVAMTVPTDILSVTGSPITSSGTLAVSKVVQTANTVFSGPTTGSAAVPAFRSLVAADIPTIDLTNKVTGTLPVANGGTGVTSSTGTGSVVLSTSPTLVTPALGTPSAAVLTNATGLPVSTGISGLGTGIATFLATPSSANLATAVTDETGSGALVFASSPTLVTPALGTPSAAVLTNATGLPVATGISGLGTGVATFLATPSSANLAAALTDETGSGAAVFATSPTLVTPALGTPSSATLTNATGLPIVGGTTGTLSVARGGTNSVTALNNNRVMQSSAGAIVEAAAITASRALASDANGIPIASVTTLAEQAFVSGVTSSIQTQLNGKQSTGNYVTALTGDVTASGPGSVAATIAVGAVTDTKASLANKPSATVVAITNQTLSGTPTIDGQATASGSIILLTAQSTGAENGPWVAAAGAWSRPTWYPSGGTTQAFQFITMLVRLGSVYQGSTWRITSSGAVTIDTTSTTWTVVTLSSGGLSSNLLISTFGANFDGGGSVIATGATTQIWVTVPYSGTITGWTLLASPLLTGSMVVDIWKVAYVSWPSTVSNSITGATPPTITSSNKGQSLSLSGWTTTVTAGDTFIFNVNSCSTLTKANLVVQMNRT